MFNIKTSELNWRINEENEKINALSFFTYYKHRRTKYKNDKVNKRYFSEETLTMAELAKLLQVENDLA